jgi:hypothetical protein
VCGLIVYLIVKSIQSYERPVNLAGEFATGEHQGDVEPDRPPGELPADVYVARARELAAAERFREAIAQLLLGAMSHLERAGLVRYRRGLTQRDYLRAARGRAAFHSALKGLLGVYEPIGFGRREATRRHFETSLADYEAGFHAGAQPLES